MYSYYPINISLRGKNCLVVGGGKVAARKVKQLLGTGAKITVVSPKIAKELKELADLGKIVSQLRFYRSEDINDAFLVIAATNCAELNCKIAHQAKRKTILVNVVDKPALCNFIMPSFVQRGDLLISISTGGKSPALARKLREELEKIYGEEYAAFVKLLGCLRKRVYREFPVERTRHSIWKQLVNSDLITLIRQKDEKTIRKRIKEILQRAKKN